MPIFHRYYDLELKFERQATGLYHLSFMRGDRRNRSISLNLEDSLILAEYEEGMDRGDDFMRGIYCQVYLIKRRETDRFLDFISVTLRSPVEGIETSEFLLNNIFRTDTYL